MYSKIDQTNCKQHIYKCVEEHFRKNRNFELVKHAIVSYNDFVEKTISKILEGFNPVKIYNGPIKTDNDKIPKHMHELEIYFKNHILQRPVIAEREGYNTDMTPMDARNRNLSYSGNLNVDLDIVGKTYNPETNDYKIERKTIYNVPLGRIPIMLRSNYCILNYDKRASDEECQFDCGGYFIISGNEKVIVSQDRFAENKPYGFINPKEPAYDWTVDIRSVHQDSFGVPKTTTIKLSNAKKCNKEGRFIRVTMHHMRTDISLFIIFRALGLTTDKEIVNYIVKNNNDPEAVELLRGSIVEARMQNVTDPTSAQLFLIKNMTMGVYPKEFKDSDAKKLEILQNKILKYEFLPHVNIESTPQALKEKCVNLGEMTYKLLKFHMKKDQKQDNRDSYLNKRVESPGMCMSNLFRANMGKVIREMTQSIQKEMSTTAFETSHARIIDILKPENIKKHVKYTITDNTFKYSMGTGNWGMRNSRMKYGVAQMLAHNSYYSKMSHLRRLNTYIDKTAKLIHPRELDNSQAFYLCLFETPEGQQIGLVKNLAMSVFITSTSDSNPVREYISEFPGFVKFDGDVFIFHDLHQKNTCKVLVNGSIIGIHENPVKLYKMLKKNKIAGILNRYISVYWDIGNAEICVNTEAGRMVRPVFVLDMDLETNERSKFDVEKILKCESIDKMIEEGYIEYLDVDECNHSLIAMNMEYLSNNFYGTDFPIKYTHMEIDPILMMGVMAGSIPFPNHNQAPRNAYQSSMAKQAIGLNVTNYRSRFDNSVHILDYGQLPLVQTRGSRIIHSNQIPSGMNAIVAIATYTGYNQEDSLVMNKSSVERGLFRSTVYKTYKEVLNKQSTGEEEFFTGNIEEKSLNNYQKLQQNGFVKENTFVKQGDALIGKVMPQRLDDSVNKTSQKSENKFKYKNTSFVLKNNEWGYVDAIAANNNLFTTLNSEGYEIAKVRLRHTREPETGDKFSSRMGQKGTNGILLKQEDMPFTKDGVSPDIIINPHAIPSRMTIGQLIECIMGKACVSEGGIGDGTSFDDTNIIENLGDKLEALGMERHGYEILYNGHTGEQMTVDIFMGPTYYQKLKHMVVDKIHSRSNNGPVVVMTRQPTEGRARDGGLRLGYMEVECLWSHGVMQFLKERFMECSDKYKVYICNNCKTLATNANPIENKFECKSCKNDINFSEVRIPYAYKLMMQEIQAMSIGMKLYT